LLRQFATFLAVEVKSKTNGALISCGTAWQYLSSIKTYLRSTYKDVALWNEDESVWYQPIRDGIEMRVSQRCFENGLLIRPIGEAVGRNLLKLVVQAYLYRENQKTFNEIIFKLLLLYYACGRAGEVAYTTWNDAR
jgi:hypothetical protein